MPLQVSPRIESSPATDLHNSGQRDTASKTASPAQIRQENHLDIDTSPPDLSSTYQARFAESEDLALSSGEASATVMWRSPDTESAAAMPTRRHRIRDGDTLSSIAEQYLGDKQRYLEIFEANRDVLNDPQLLPIDKEIVIPQNADMHDIPADSTENDE